ncbi:hypothetical protein LTR85_006430 [Meristemomyces frigidus]|nr:hypothetical protein LTR85_006430 [Meristemomyces frigidus]
MLGPRYREGVQLASSSALEITLLEDDVKTLIHLLGVIHLRDNAAPQTLKATEMVDVVNFARKYVCLAAVQPKGKAFTLAYRLGLDDMVNKIALAIVNCSTWHTKVADQYAMYGTDGDEELEVLFGLLKRYKDERLSNIQCKITDAIDLFERTRDVNEAFELGRASHMCPDSCHVAELSAYELKRLLRERELDDRSFYQHELREALGHLKAMPTFPFSNRYVPCSKVCYYHRLAGHWNSDFLKNEGAEFDLPKKLVCMEGYRESGRWDCMGLGYCDHCGTGVH